MNIVLILGMAFGGFCIFVLVVWLALWFVDKIPDDYDLGKKDKNKTKKGDKK